jgi:hypothetical protein
MEKYGFSTTGSQDGYVPTGSWNESQGQSSKNEIPQSVIDTTLHKMRENSNKVEFSIFQ